MTSATPTHCQCTVLPVEGERAFDRTSHASNDGAVGDQRLAIASHASFINFFHDNDLGIEPVLEIVSISISPFLP